MEEVLPPWASLATWVGLVIFVVLSLVRRWLIPKSHHEEIVALMSERLKDMETRINDRDELIVELKAANVALDARNDLLSDQVSQLVGVGHVTASVIASQATDAGATDGRLAAGDRHGAPTKASSRTEASGNQTTARRGGRRR